MASYNAGPGRIQRAVKQSKIANYWDLTESSRYLPKETRNYVPMIMAAVLIAKNPQAYGFEPGTDSPLAFDRVTVPDALDLRTVAEWTGSTIEDIRDLNPELWRTTTPIGAHDLKVPAGMAPVVEGKLASADPSLFAQFSEAQGQGRRKSGHHRAAIPGDQDRSGRRQQPAHYLETQGRPVTADSPRGDYRAGVASWWRP